MTARSTGADPMRTAFWTLLIFVAAGLTYMIVIGALHR